MESLICALSDGDMSTESIDGSNVRRRVSVVSSGHRRFVEYTRCIVSVLRASTADGHLVRSGGAITQYV